MRFSAAADYVKNVGRVKNDVGAGCGSACVQQPCAHAYIVHPCMKDRACETATDCCCWTDLSRATQARCVLTWPRVEVFVIGG